MATKWTSRLWFRVIFTSEQTSDVWSSPQWGNHDSTLLDVVCFDIIVIAKVPRVSMSLRLSAVKPARRRRVPLPTLCEIKYENKQWRRGVYCSSCHPHNFRSLSAPPSDLQQEEFYKPTTPNEPVTIGSRMPAALSVSSCDCRFSVWTVALVQVSWRHWATAYH